MNDPIADMLIQIKNAQAVLKPTVEVSFSKIKSAIAEILKKEGFIGKIKRKKRKGKRILEIELKYEDKKGPHETPPANDIHLPSDIPFVQFRKAAGFHLFQGVELDNLDTGDILPDPGLYGGGGLLHLAKSHSQKGHQ